MQTAMHCPLCSGEMVEDAQGGFTCLQCGTFYASLQALEQAQTAGMPQLLDTASGLEAKGRLKEARALYERVLLKNPQEYRAHLGLAEISCATAWEQRVSIEQEAHMDVKTREVRGKQQVLDAYDASLTNYRRAARVAPPERAEEMHREAHQIEQEIHSFQLYIDQIEAYNFTQRLEEIDREVEKLRESEARIRKSELAQAERFQQAQRKGERVRRALAVAAVLAAGALWVARWVLPVHIGGGVLWACSTLAVTLVVAATVGLDRRGQTWSRRQAREASRERAQQRMLEQISYQLVSYNHLRKEFEKKLKALDERAS